MVLRSLHLSLAEYDAMVLKGAFEVLNRRVELVRGEVVERNPAGPLHDDCITYLNNWSSDARDKNATQITSQTGIDLPDVHSRPEPDVFWVRRARYRDRHPQAVDVQLAIEVADSSQENDLGIKRHLYAEVGIVEYWIVDCQNRCVHVFRDPEGSDYRSHRIASGSETIAPRIAPDARLDLQDLFSGE